MRLPPTPSTRQCRCNRPLDALSHHRVHVQNEGFGKTGLRKRECICSNLPRNWRELSPTPCCANSTWRHRTPKISADWRSWWMGCRSVEERTGSRHDSGVSCALQRVPSSLPAIEDGPVLTATRRLKDRKQPELVGPSQARMVVLASEIGGRWSEKTPKFLSLMIKVKAKSEPPILKKRAEQTWNMRWRAIFYCGTARAFVTFLLELNMKEMLCLLHRPLPDTTLPWPLVVFSLDLSTSSKWPWFLVPLELLPELSSRETTRPRGPMIVHGQNVSPQCPAGDDASSWSTMDGPAHQLMNFILLDGTNEIVPQAVSWTPTLLLGDGTREIWGKG